MTQKTIERRELHDLRMRYTPSEIALYNSKAYHNFVNGMRIIRGSDTWVPPNIEKITNDQRN